MFTFLLNNMIITEIAEDPKEQAEDLHEEVNQEEAVQALAAQDEPEISELGDVDPAVLVPEDVPDQCDEKPNVLEELEAKLPPQQIEKFREILKESGLQNELDENADLSKDDIRKLIEEARGNRQRQPKNVRRQQTKKGKAETESDEEQELIRAKRKIQKKKKMEKKGKGRERSNEYDDRLEELGLDLKSHKHKEKPRKGQRKGPKKQEFGELFEGQAFGDLIKQEMAKEAKQGDNYDPTENPDMMKILNMFSEMRAGIEEGNESAKGHKHGQGSKRGSVLNMGKHTTRKDSDSGKSDGREEHPKRKEWVRGFDISKKQKINEMKRRRNLPPRGKPKEQNKKEMVENLRTN